MIAAPNATATHRMHERDNASWQAQIDLAISTPDPALANLRITAAHYQLSQALSQILGLEAGANFHTWATWGSKKAGKTIRHEELPQLGALALLIGGGLGLLVPATMPQRPGASRLLARAAGTLLGGCAVATAVRRCRDHASRMVLGGNIAVLDDIGRQTARFVSTFQGHPAPDPQRLADSLVALRPGPSAAGGQGLLAKAFTHYYHAMHAGSAARRHDHMLLANLYAILHEHIRLQPYISGAMPIPARRLITRYLLDFSLGRRTMSVGKDVVPPEGAGRPHLAASAELQGFLDHCGRAQGGVLGSRAHNWADIRDRMAFICALLRTGHCDQGLFTAPYTAPQLATIAAGSLPGGAL